MSDTIVDERSQQDVIQFPLENDSDYTYMQITFDQGCINGGVPVTYLPNGAPLRTTLAGYGGDIDMWQSGWLYRYQPNPAVVATGLIPAESMDQLWEPQDLTIGNGCVVAQSAKNYSLFNKFTNKTMKNALSDMQNEINKGSNFQLQTYNISSNANVFNGDRTLQNRLYDYIQKKGIQRAEREYDIVASGAMTLSTNIYNQYYFTSFADIYPQVQSMGEMAHRFPLSSVPQIISNVRFQGCQQTHILSGINYANTVNLKQTSDSYSISDVVFVRIEYFKSDAQRLVAEKRLANSIVQRFTGLDYQPFPITVLSGLQQWVVTSAINDLRAIIIMFTQTDTNLATYGANSASQSVWACDKNYPWSHNRYAYPVILDDLYYQVSGSSTRFPANEKLVQAGAFINPHISQLMFKQTFGKDTFFNQNFYDLLTGGMIYMLPFQRSVQGQPINLSLQSNTLTLSAKFSQTQMVSTPLTGLQVHVWKLYDQDLILQNGRQQVR